MKRGRKNSRGYKGNKAKYKGSGGSKFIRDSKGNKKRRVYDKIDIFLSRLGSILQVPKGRVREMFSYRITSVIRLNNLLGKPEKILRLLQEYDLVMEEVPWAPHTYLIKNMDKSDLARLAEYKKGLFYIQGLSSMVPALELDIQPTDKVLDMCAAPGSKTTQIASFMNNQSQIFANEQDYPRSRKLLNVLRLFGVKNTEVKVSDGRDVGEKLPNHFDKVLLDAPCSGEAQIFLPSPKSLRFWSIKKVNIMSRIQKDLIISAFQALKPGGTLVYSTCTLEPDENEAVVKSLLDAFDEAELVEVGLKNSKEFEAYKEISSNGISKWSGQVFGNNMKKCMRIMPSKSMEAFFVAKIKKGV